MTRRLLAAMLACLALAPAASATHPQPAPDINRLEYAPVGHFKDGDPLPAPNSCDALLPLTKNGVFNPSGKHNAFDTEIFEVLCLPFRAPGDESDQDPYGNGGDPRHGFCAQPSDSAARPGNPAYQPGVCANHQLEYVRYFADTMREILGDFGASTKQYFFEVTQAQTGTDGPSAPPANTLHGRAINPAVVVPGTDHPDESVIIGAHYDQTNDGPASAWDSQEGHAEIIRVAKLMADYWRATGTRPSATVKFIPWDAEESGTLGSLDYTENNIVPTEADKVRGYWNTDPCAGGYPSFVAGNPAYRTTMGIQLGDVGTIAEGKPARITAFNERAPKLIEQVLEHVDDTVPTIAGDVETFIAAGEGTSDLGGPFMSVGTDRPVLFGSDWRNFIRLGIPFFNPGPEVTGPNQGGGSYSPGGPPLALVGFHSPADNLQTMMQYTAPPPAGVTISTSWAKGMEFCSHMLAWGMLQSDQGGAQTTNTDVVAYAEVLPNEAPLNAQVTFDATGSYQYADDAKRRLTPDDDLEYRWDFGDGSPTHYGKVLTHSYKRLGSFRARLTVENVRTGKNDSMQIPVMVNESALPLSGADSPPGSPKPRSGGGATGCDAGTGFVSAAARPSGRGLRFDFQRGSESVVRVDILQVTRGKRALRRPKRVRSFRVSEPFTWNGRLQRGRLSSGVYEARVTTTRSGVRDTRRFALTRTGRGFRLGKPVAITESCDTVSAFSLGAPAFARKLAIQYRLRSSAQVMVTVKRGKRTVKRFRTRTMPAKRTHRLSFTTRRRGTYRITLRARTAGRTVTKTLYARKL